MTGSQREGSGSAAPRRQNSAAVRVKCTACQKDVRVSIALRLGKFNYCLPCILEALAHYCDVKAAVLEEHDAIADLHALLEANLTEWQPPDRGP